MISAMQLSKTGGPEVLKPVELPLPLPSATEATIRHTAIGLNYIDVYQRSGLYPVPLPFTPGFEAAGVVEAVGASVTRVKVGDRVAYGRGPLGAYCTKRNMPADELVIIPKNVADEVAASAMLKGLTAWYLLHQTFPVKRGDTILIHAAAGGVGLILSQWAKQLGARVIGTVGSEDKARLARQAGCDEIIFYRTENTAERVRALTDGKGVDVVYDAVGQTTFTSSLDSLKPLGLMVSYGQASGPLPPFESKELSSRGSLFFTRPTLFDYIRDVPTYHTAAEALLNRISAGDIAITVAQRVPLSDASKAHAALEARETVGSTVLIP